MVLSRSCNWSVENEGRGGKSYQTLWQDVKTNVHIEIWKLTYWKHIYKTQLKHKSKLCGLFQAHNHLLFFFFCAGTNVITVPCSV